jgi:hypothetical protein
LLIIFATTIGLVAWALHLMRAALARREFSLMLAGCLVVAAAAALLVVYVIMDDYRGFMSQTAALPPLENWYVIVEEGSPSFVSSDAIGMNLF